MARNGSGAYSKVNTFVAGTTITASDHNENWDDLASEITNSVAADGQTSMSGQLKLSSGTAAAPAVVFASDTDTGIYRVSANDIGIAVGGSKVVDISSTGAAVTGDVSATGALKQGGFSLLPAGVIFPYGGTAAPTGYLLCFGQSLLRASYPDLFTAIGTTFGAADGTHFSLPDLRGRVTAGKDDMGGSAASRLTSTWFGTSAAVLGAVGGNEKNALSATNQLPQFTPAGTVTNGSITQMSINTGSAAGGGSSMVTGGFSTGGSFTTGGNGLSFTQGASSFAGTAVGAASPSSFAISQPTIILNYIIFAGV